MWSAIQELPSDVCKICVVDFTSLADIVQLDEALASDNSGIKYLRSLLNNCGPFELPSSVVHNSEAWQWFWKRSMSVDRINCDISYTEVCDGLAIAEKYLDLIATGICITGFRTVDSANNLDYLSCHSDLAAKIIGVDASKILLQSFLKDCSQLTSLHEITWQDDSDNNYVCGIIERNVHVKRVRQYTKKGPDQSVLHSLGVREATLRVLEIACDVIDTECLPAIGTCCRLLETLKVSHTKDLLTVTNAALQPIAQGCSNLQIIELTKCCADNSLELFAQYSHQLQSFTSEVDLTNAALTYLQKNCPNLTQIVGIRPVASVTHIQKHASLLQQLRECIIHPPGNAQTWEQRMHSKLIAIIRAIPNMRKFVVGGCTTNASVLKAIGESCHELECLHCEDSTDAPGMEAALVAIAQGTPQLQTLIIRGKATAGDALLYVLSQNCPMLRVLRCSAARAGVSDAAVVALAHRCPRLATFIELIGGHGVTDVSLMALAEHCRNLTTVDLRRCRNVSDDAVVHLFLRCRKLNNVVMYKDAVGIVRKLVKEGVPAMQKEKGSSKIMVSP